VLGEATADPKLFVRWLAKGFWAVSDQGLFAVSNFALSVLLARWLSPQDYGAFATAFAVFLLIGTLHTGLLTEPMLVFGSGRYKNRLSEYLGALLYGHLGFGVLCGLLLVLISLGLALSGSSALATVLLALALAGPFISLLWLMRRASYARFEPSLATLGGALYMVLMLAGAYAWYQLEWLSAASALGLMGLSSLVVSLWLAVRLRIKQPPFRDDKLAREALEYHWRYGRWSTATLGLSWACGQIYYLFLPLWHGLEASASLKALMNLILPIQMATMALSILLVPSLTQARGEARFSTLVRFATMFFVLCTVLYWLFLGLFHGPLMTLLYGGQYAEDANLLWILGLMPISAGVSGVLGAVLRAFERPDLAFWAYVLSATLSVTLGLLMVFMWGVVGAVLGEVVCSAAITGATIYLLIAFKRRVLEKT
jgi:O-antigen/teichoic acid export membrane protein